MRTILITFVFIAALSSIASADHSVIASNHLQKTYSIAEKQIRIQIALIKNNKFKDKVFGKDRGGDIPINEYIVERAFKENDVSVRKNSLAFSIEGFISLPNYDGACMFPHSPHTLLALLPIEPLENDDLLNITDTFKLYSELYSILLNELISDDIPYRSIPTGWDRNNQLGMSWALQHDSKTGTCYMANYGNRQPLPTYRVFGNIYGIKGTFYSKMSWSFPGFFKQPFIENLDAGKYSSTQLDFYISAFKFLEKYPSFYNVSIDQKLLLTAKEAKEENEGFGSLLSSQSDSTEEDSSGSEFESLLSDSTGTTGEVKDQDTSGSLKIEDLDF